MMCLPKKEEEEEKREEKKRRHPAAILHIHVFHSSFGIQTHYVIQIAMQFRYCIFVP